MEFFGDQFAANIIAQIFYNADKEVRREMINDQNPLEVNERDRVSTLCALIRHYVSQNPFIRSFSIQAHARDTTRRDALFVFRYKEEIKIGLFEAKLLRINGANLNDTWDWFDGNRESHFTKQVVCQQLWINEAAVWDMFIPNCNIGQHSPSFERKGSSNIWSDEMISKPKISKPQQLWTYQDVLNAKEQYLSIYQVVKEILRCNKGKRHNITGKTEFEITSSDPNIKMPIPIPRNMRLGREVLNSFFSNNESIDSFNYYRFDDLVYSIKDFKEKGEINTPNYIKSKKTYSIESVNEFISIVNSSYDNLTN